MTPKKAKFERKNVMGNFASTSLSHRHNIQTHKVFPEELSIGISGPSIVSGPLQCGWALFNPLKAEDRNEKAEG